MTNTTAKTLIISALPLFLLPLNARAQEAVTTDIQPDSTLPNNTQVNQNGNTVEITGGTSSGSNLFHSFNSFSVGTGDTASSQNINGNIQDVFSRVTGSSISNIDGMIQVLNSNANLYLMNPNGIIFGENASLDIGGSFFATTADSILFEDNVAFSASDPTTPLLTSSIPIGARFRDNPGDIINRSFAQNDVGDFAGLEVETGKNLTLLGGNLNFEAGNATARGGNVYLGGLAQAGIVDLNEDGSLSFPQDVTLANISLTNDAGVNVRSAGGGNIAINAQNLSLATGNFGSSFILGGIASDSNNSEAQAGDIVVNVTDNITLNDSFIANLVDSGSIGDSGSIAINTGSLELINGGQVNASNLGTGNAGMLTVTATGDIIANGESLINGSSSRIISAVGADAEGNAGTINISANNLTIKNGGRVQAIAGGQGNAGGINISTNNLSLLNGGTINNSIFGKGMGGVINVTATENIIFDGEDLNGSLSGIFNLVSSGAMGDGGDIKISTNNLTLNNGGQISANTLGKGDAGAIEIEATGDLILDGEAEGFSSIISNTVEAEAVGDSGGVKISTNNLTLTNGGEISAATLGQGNAGNIEIEATGDVSVDGQNLQGSVSTINNSINPGAKGKAGEIIIFTNNLTLSNGGQIVASTLGQGDAGTTRIFATGNITLSGEANITLSEENSFVFNSGIANQVGLNAEGNAGGIEISTNNLTLIDGAGIDTSVFGNGDAGSIEINATGDIKLIGEDSINEASVIASQSIPLATGNAGKITISTTNLILNDGGYIETSCFSPYWS